MDAEMAGSGAVAAEDQRHRARFAEEEEAAAAAVEVGPAEKESADGIRVAWFLVA